MAYKVLQRVGLFRHGHMDAADYALSVFDFHLSKASIDKHALQGKTILEIGPGDSITTAIIAHASESVVDGCQTLKHHTHTARENGLSILENV